MEKHFQVMNIHKRSSNIALASWLVSVIILALPLQLSAEMSTGKGDLNQLSKELVNPIGPNWLINTYLNTDKMHGDVTDESRSSTEWLLQPVMPIPLDHKKMGLTMMNRLTLPIIFDKSFPQMDTNDFSGFKKKAGLGDLTIQTSFGSMPKTSFGMYMWGVGMDLMFPTASADELGSGKYSAGPSGMLVGYTTDYTFGCVLSHAWSFAGKSNRKNVSTSKIQPLYYKQLGNGWQVGDNPTWSIDWKAESGDSYEMPIGLGLFKTSYIHGVAWRLGVTPRYYIKTHKSWGNDWEVSFTITPVLKNPFNNKPL
jgi:hypothetical protein